MQVLFFQIAASYDSTPSKPEKYTIATPNTAIIFIFQCKDAHVMDMVSNFAMIGIRENIGDKP